MKITIVPDAACPGCGAYWGHPDPALDFPNRVRVDDHYKCYNPACEVGYYSLDGSFIEYKLPPEEQAEMHARIVAEVDEMMKGKTWELDPNSPPGIESYRLVPVKKEE